jgi:predicted XRE-type DNA-binding protein
MDTKLIEKIKVVTQSPDLLMFMAEELLKKGIILTYDFDKKQAFASINLRAKIIDRLEHLQMSKTELAKLVGVDRRHISRYLLGGSLSDKTKERIIGTLELIKPFE